MITANDPLCTDLISSNCSPLSDRLVQHPSRAIGFNQIWFALCNTQECGELVVKYVLLAEYHSGVLRRGDMDGKINHQAPHPHHPTPPHTLTHPPHPSKTPLTASLICLSHQGICSAACSAPPSLTGKSLCSESRSWKEVFHLYFEESKLPFEFDRDLDTC